MNQKRSEEAVAQLLDTADAYWEILLERNPTMATDLGDHRYDHLLPDYSAEARAAYFAKIHDLVERFHTIPPEAVNGQHATTYVALKSMLELELAAEPFQDDEWTINPLHGPTTWLAEFSERQPLHPRGAFERLLERFRGSANLFATVEQRLSDGIAKGMTASRIGVGRLTAQLQRILATPPEKSAFIPSGPPPEGMTQEQFDRQKQELADVVEKIVYPALGRHADFLEKTYLPVARTTPGLCGMPGGAEYYRYLIRLYTGRGDSPEDIHELGRQEIRRLHAEMVEIGQRERGATSIRDIVETIKARKDQYLPDRKALLEYNRELLERAQAALPDYFGRLPARQCEVRPVERFREIDAPSGFYSRAPDDGLRPAYYNVNTHHPHQRPIFNLEALAFHEAVPGHHLQIAIAQDLHKLPAFRRHLGQTAYVEGWALYAERLADEMGLYSSQLARFGMLNYQVWRAARLMIDTGIHAMGWSREKAISELLACTAHGEAEAVIEVDRYICMPGQALSYMIGRMAIDALRSTAEAALGPQFDLKQFHDVVLEHGAIPLATLEGIVARWIQNQLREGTPTPHN